MEPLIVTVAAVGAEISLEQQPNLPVTPEQLARDAAECREVGASIYHLHVRDAAGQPTMDVATFDRARAAIGDACDLIVQFTTGGSTSDDLAARIAPLDLGPEMASLTTGTVNFGEDVFSNPASVIKSLYERMLQRSVLPEFEIFEGGMIATADRMYEDLGARHHRHYDFVLGVPGAMPAWGDAVPFLASKLPAGATWSATGIGRHNFPVAAAAIAHGGHVRTGFEDVLYIERGTVASSNRQLVERVVEMARATGRDIASPSSARQVLGL